MTLFDCDRYSVGTVKAIGGDRDTHRRLADMGLLGAKYRVRVVKKRSVLVDFGTEFSAVVEADIAAQVEVIENCP